MLGLSRSQLLVLLLTWLACVVAPLGSTVLTEHEVFAAEPGREMLAGHGLVLQPFAGKFRTKKPPGQSWLIAASIGITRVRNEWTARLPSALFGLGMAVVTASIAARLASSRRGLIAGLMTLLCVGVQQRARLAEADIGLAFCVALANAMVLKAVADALPGPERTRGLAGAFWAAVVAGFMLKGPIVFGFSLLPAAVAWAVLRFGRHDRAAATAVRRVAFWWPAIVVGMLLIAAWPVSAWRIYPGVVAQWKHELFDRVSGDLGHGDERRHDPLVAYGWMIPFAVLPWFPFALGAAWAWRRRLRWRAADVVLACWAGAGAVMLSLIAFKVLHYALPIVPPFVLLAAAGFDRALTVFLRHRPKLQRTTWERASLATWFGGAAVAWAGYQSVVLPIKDPGIEVPRFARHVNAAVPAGRTVYLFRVGEDRTAWYLDAPLRQTDDLPPRPAYLICTKADLAVLRAAGPTTVLAEAKPFVAREADGAVRVLARVD